MLVGLMWYTDTDRFGFPRMKLILPSPPFIQVDTHMFNNMRFKEILFVDKIVKTSILNITLFTTCLILFIDILATL